jgi:hypothetical protein
MNEEFGAKLMDDMEPALLEFVRNKVNSFIKWDLIRFFHENPNTADTAENIAHYAGRNVSAVEPELEGLVESKVMAKRFTGQTAIYSLPADPSARELIEKFALACEDRHFRVKAVYHIIKNMQ